MARAESCHVPHDASPPTAAERRAFALDAAIHRMAKRRGALEVALGATLLDLFKGNRLLEAGFSKRVDYADARGIPRSSMFEWTSLARGLETRPVLRRAVLCGAVTPNKARAVMRAAEGDDEEFWTAAAMRSSLATLKRAVKAEGKESLEEGFETETLWLRMTPQQQDRVDAALLMAKRLEGFGAPAWRLNEALAEEYLSGHLDFMPDAQRGGLGAAEELLVDPAWRARTKGHAKSLRAMLDLLDEVDDAVEGHYGAPPEEAEGLGYDARVQRMLKAWKRFDLVFGQLLERVQREEVAKTLKYAGFAEYCGERLGLCARTARQRIALERQMCGLPPLREAYESGRLNYSQAVIVGREAGWDNVHELIERAARTTTQQTRRESEARQAKKDRARGGRRLWGPKDSLETVLLAIATARAVAAEDLRTRQGNDVRARDDAAADLRTSDGDDGGAEDDEAADPRTSGHAGSAGRVPPAPLDPGEAWARVADHFVETWRDHLTPVPKARWKVLMRAGGLCAVPHCSRQACDVHHMVYRSRRGPEELWNKVGLCWQHHHAGVHGARLWIAGRAGELLVWRLGAEAVDSEEWITIGDDDVRRRDDWTDEDLRRVFTEERAAAP